MTKVILSDNSTYELKGTEYLTYGVVGIYIWKNEKQENPPVRFYVYGFVREVHNDERTSI